MASKIDDLKLVRELTYVELDQRGPLSDEGRQQQAHFLDFWKGYWSNIVRHLGHDDEIDSEDFYNQHKLTALMHRGNIVAMHTMSVYDKSDFQTSPYFANFGGELLAALMETKVDRLLTLQYLAFNPEWQKIKNRAVAVLPMTIVSLSMRQQRVERADSVLSVARRDVGASNSLIKMGFTEMLPADVYKSTPVSYQISPNPRPYPNALVAELTDYFWQRRKSLNPQPELENV